MRSDTISSSSTVSSSAISTVSSSAVSTVSSSVATIYGIPVLDILVAVLLILFILYLLCRIKRKDRHSLKKASYIKLFIACFVPLFIYNLYNMYDGLRFTASLIFLNPNPFIMTIILTIALSLTESVIPYLFITLSILIINCFRK
jgi:hypothetical protein